MKERIQNILNREKLTSSEFADYIGINRPTMSHILSGRNNVSLDVLTKIHLAFPKISLKWLFDGTGPYLEEDAVLETAMTSVNAEDNTIDPSAPSSIPSPSSEATNVENDLTAPYQRDLFTENGVIPSEVHAQPEYRKDLVSEKPPLAANIADNQRINIIQKVNRSITEIKIFYDDGTYETFQPTPKQ